MLWCGFQGGRAASSFLLIAVSEEKGVVEGAMLDARRVFFIDASSVGAWDRSG